MLYFDRIDISEQTDVNKTSASIECAIFHYWYFLNKGFKFQPNVCNRFHDLRIMTVNLSGIAILNITGCNYCFIISRISKGRAITLMQSTDLIKQN